VFVAVDLRELGNGWRFARAYIAQRRCG